MGTNTINEHNHPKTKVVTTRDTLDHTLENAVVYSFPMRTICFLLWTEKFIAIPWIMVLTDWKLQPFLTGGGITLATKATASSKVMNSTRNEEVHFAIRREPLGMI